MEKEILVTYTGPLGGFFKGQIIAAVARDKFLNGQPANFRIKDEDGDYYTVSKDGKTFENGWRIVTKYEAERLKYSNIEDDEDEPYRWDDKGI